MIPPLIFITGLRPQLLTQEPPVRVEQAEPRSRKKHINYTSGWVPRVNMQLLWKGLVTSRKDYSRGRRKDSLRSSKKEGMEEDGIRAGQKQQLWMEVTSWDVETAGKFQYSYKIIE